MKIIYTKTDCPACVSLKQTMKRDNEDFLEMLIGKDISREDFLKKFPGVRTVPFLVDSSILPLGEVK